MYICEYNLGPEWELNGICLVPNISPNEGMKLIWLLMIVTTQAGIQVGIPYGFQNYWGFLVSIHLSQSVEERNQEEEVKVRFYRDFNS